MFASYLLRVAAESAPMWNFNWQVGPDLWPFGPKMGCQFYVLRRILPPNLKFLRRSILDFTGPNGTQRWNDRRITSLHNNTDTTSMTTGFGGVVGGNSTTGSPRFKSLFWGRTVSWTVLRESNIGAPDCTWPGVCMEVADSAQHRNQFKVRAEHLRVVFPDFPWPSVACFPRLSRTFVAPCCRTLYKLLCHFASNLPVVTNANVLQMSVISNSWCHKIPTKYRMWPKFFTSNHSEKSSITLSHQLFALSWISRT